MNEISWCWVAVVSDRSTIVIVVVVVVDLENNRSIVFNYLYTNGFSLSQPYVGSSWSEHMFEFYGRWNLNADESEDIFFYHTNKFYVKLLLQKLENCRSFGNISGIKKFQALDLKI